MYRGLLGSHIQPVLTILNHETIEKTTTSIAMQCNFMHSSNCLKLCFMGVIGSDECVSFLKIEFIGREHAATACAGQSTVPLFLAAMAAGANAKSSTSTSFIVTVVTRHNSKNGLELHQSLQSIPLSRIIYSLPLNVANHKTHHSTAEERLLPRAHCFAPTLCKYAAMLPSRADPIAVAPLLHRKG